jgi:C4-dicarboxylate-specific signal transduction histidine kinase
MTIPNCDTVSRARRVVQATIVLCLAVGYVVVGGCFDLFDRFPLIYVQFACVPVLLAGFWWGFRSLWIAGLLAASILLMRSHEGSSFSFASGLVSAVMLFALALVVGTLRHRLRVNQRALMESEERHRVFVARHEEAERRRQEITDLSRKQEEQLIHSTRLAELGEMAAAIAHELKQPLTGIRNYARNAFYMLDKEAGTPEEVKTNLRLISDQVDRAARIINQMRDLTRKAEPQFAPLDINATVKESLDFLAPQLKLSKVTVVLELATEMPRVLGDHVRLEQVFLNILSNAWQAMDESPIRILAIRSRYEAGLPLPIVVEISDSGKGFSDEDADKLFTAFYSTKKAGHGTGLGLSISLSIIKEHQGRIEAVGTPGKGATFTIRLPAHQPAVVTEDDTVAGSARQ